VITYLVIGEEHEKLLGAIFIAMDTSIYEVAEIR
jgi:hypothetical protein